MTIPSWEDKLRVLSYITKNSAALAFLPQIGKWVVFTHGVFVVEISKEHGPIPVWKYKEGEMCYLPGIESDSPENTVCILFNRLTNLPANQLIRRFSYNESRIYFFRWDHAIGSWVDYSIIAESKYGEDTQPCTFRIERGYGIVDIPNNPFLQTGNKEILSQIAELRNMRKVILE